MGRIVHFEIPADDLSRTKKFYSTVFGWKMTEAPEMEYVMVGTTESDENGMPKAIVRSFGLNPEEILTREALENPHRAVIGAGIEVGQVDTLLKALKQKLKEELTTETRTTQLTTVQVTT